MGGTGSGGKREGAGAPQGNTNALRNGGHTAAAIRRRQINKLILKCVQLLAQALIIQRAIAPPPPSELDIDGDIYKLEPQLEAEITAFLRRAGFLAHDVGDR